MRKRLLTLIASLPYRGIVPVLLIVVLLTTGAVYEIQRHLRIETDVIDLLPQSSKVAQTFRRVLDDFGPFDHTLVVIESESGSSRNLIQSVENFGQLVATPLYVQSVDYRISREEMTFFLQENPDERIVGLLTKKDREEIIKRLHPENIAKQLKRLKVALLHVTSPKKRRLQLEDPLNLAGTIRNRLVHSYGPIAANIRHGYFMSPDNRMLIMVVKPVRPASDVAFTVVYGNFLSRVREQVLDRQTDYSDDISIGFLGSHIETLHDTEVIKRDLIYTAVTSFILVIVLFIIAFRRLSAFYFVGLPLLIGISWTLGLTAVVMERITIVTMAFSAVLIGLGIDFAIHIYNRFVEEIGKRHECKVALTTAITATGESIMTGAFTTAIAFYGMMFSSFRGFRELGFVAGSGILCCLISIYLVLPLLLRLRFMLNPERILRTRVSGFGLKKVSEIIQGYPRSAIALGLILTVYFGFQATFMEFDEDVRKLRQLPEEYTELHHAVTERFELPSQQVAAIVRGSILEEALEKNDALYDKIEYAKTEYDYPVLSLDSLRTFLPSVQTQLESRRMILQIDIDALKSSLEEDGRKIGLEPRTFDLFLARLRSLQAAASDAPFIMLKKGLTLNPVFYQLVLQYMKTADLPRRYEVLTRIYPTEGKWENIVPETFLNFLAKDLGKVEFTGVSIISSELDTVIKRDLALVILIVIFSIFLLLILHFGSIKAALLAIIPVLCGTIWMVGTMQLLGIKMNYLNIVVAPMIIGIGVDNGIHLLHRFYETENPDLNAIVQFTGRAIMITSLTTLLGFGSLALASYRGVREMGLLSIIGVGFCLIASIGFLPAILKIWSRRRKISDIIGLDDGEIR